MPLPRWLLVHGVGDLERKLIGPVVTVLSVVFLGQIVTWDGERDLLGFGVAIGAVIAGLTFLLHEPRTPHSKTKRKRRPGQRPADRPRQQPRTIGSCARPGRSSARAPVAAGLLGGDVIDLGGSDPPDQQRQSHRGR